MSDIGNLIIKIGADASGLEKAFKQLGGSAAQFQRGLETMGKVASTAFFAAATAATAMAVAAGKQAEELTQLATVTGINTDKLQEYDVMLHRAGLEGQDLALVMKTISTNLDQARQGTGSAGDRFRQLGIDIRTVTSTDNLIKQVAQAASQFADGTAKAAVMADLLGRGWQTFMRAFAGGKKAFDDVTASSKALGLTLSTTQLTALTKMDDKIDDMFTSLKRFGQQMAVLLAPSITMIVGLLQDLFAWGSHAFNGLNLLLDIWATKLQHTVLKAQELLSVLFSSDLMSPAAWKKALDNITLIGKEEDKQIKTLRATAMFSRSGAPADTRQQLPAMVDTSKISQQEQALLDASYRRFQTAAQGKEAIAQAEAANRMAVLDRENAYGIKSDMETAQARQQVIAEMDAVTESSLQAQLNGFRKYVAAKNAVFTDDEKGQAERLKFAEDAAREEMQIINKITVAQKNADTDRITSGLKVKSFWMQQLEDIKNSNAFSVSLIINTWTGGVANAMVNGGKFVEQAWKATEVAIIQGMLNLAIQWAAKQALMVVASQTAAAATELTWGAAMLAVQGFFVETAVAFRVMMASMVEVLTAIGEAIMEVLSAIAEALFDTLFGAPWAAAILAGVVLIGAALGALAATGNLGFSEGGIGNFGSGTPAMLHNTEAIIPLDSRGASFMQQALGTGSDQPIHTHVYLNGRQIAMAISDDLPGALRTMGTL